MEEIIKQLDALYGPGKGLHVYNTIMPGIIADFNKMLASAPAGKEISEEYRLDDGKGSVIIKGKRSSNGETSMTSTFSI
ncbi:MAG: hypothetical protein K6F86_00765 [Lachnospiraceae bacterium]|nr:hypothetical protein [Lachnospiraceae bacterium]